MSFEEWEILHIKTRGIPSPKDVWNAAIDEAVKVAKEGHTYTPTSTAHNIAKRIKELKE